MMWDKGQKQGDHLAYLYPWDDDGWISMIAMVIVRNYQAPYVIEKAEWSRCTSWFIMGLISREN